jgi:hypothetical protein
MYFGREKKPEEGIMIICRCPNWCDSGYQIAKFEDGIFCYDDQPNDAFDENVIAWTPLDEDGEQTESIHKPKADKWDALGKGLCMCTKKHWAIEIKNNRCRICGYPLK